MGDLATWGLIIAAAATVVFLIFGREASLMRAVAALKIQRASRPERGKSSGPVEWRHADHLVQQGERLASDRRETRKILDSQWLTDSLADLYPDHPLLVVDGVRMPVWAIPAHPDQESTPDSVLGHLSGTTPRADSYPEQFCPGGAPSFQRKHEQRLKLSELERHQLSSDPTYSLSKASLDLNGRLKLDCHMGRYFTHLATTRALGHELVGALGAFSRKVALHR